MTATAVQPREKIGLLAGAGRFPIVVAEKARSLNVPVVCVGIRHEAPHALESLVSRFYWSGILRLGRIIRCFKHEGVRRIVMAGKIHKTRLYTPFRFLRYIPDCRTLKLLYSRMRANNSDDSMLLAIINEFAGEGMQFESALDICPELLVDQGVLTQRRPKPSELEDIEYGWHLAKEMGRLDVGQSVAVKERAVLAVEAIEGTDRAIMRAGQLCRNGGFTVVKVAKPQQDMRFDVPTIGQDTVETIHNAGGRVLAIEANKTIVLDQEQTIALANRYGICIVAR